jgi:hypothetical protein
VDLTPLPLGGEIQGNDELKIAVHVAANIFDLNEAFVPALKKC